MGPMKEKSKISITTKKDRNEQAEHDRMAREMLLDLDDVEDAMDELKERIQKELNRTDSLKTKEKLRHIQNIALQITLDLGKIKAFCGGLRSRPKQEVWK